MERSVLKVIIWDLDGTVWDSALRTDADNLFLRVESIRILEAAHERGIIQSVASRNDNGAAMAKLREFGLDRFFIFPQIDAFTPKNESIAKIAERFNVDMESVAFVDDDPFERYRARRYFPDIETYDAQTQLDALFERVTRTPSVTAGRAELMRTREKRLDAKEAFKGSHEEFLAECHMRLFVREAKPADFPRLAELALRSNKLNNTRERMTAEELTAYTAAHGQTAFACELTDIFGNHGIVGLCLLRHEPIDDALFLDLFCVSCRVEGSGVGTAFLTECIKAEHALTKARCVKCGYVINNKDLSAYMLLKGLGFRQGNAEGGRVALELELPVLAAAPKWIEVNYEAKDTKRRITPDDI